MQLLEEDQALLEGDLMLLEANSDTVAGSGCSYWKRRRVGIDPDVVVGRN